MVAMTTYRAIASLDDEHGWAIRVPRLGAYPDDGLPTWAPKLAKVEATVRDLVAVYLDVPESSFDVEVHIELPDDVRHHLELARKLAEEAAAAQSEAAQERRAAAGILKASGLTVRDIGEALGVSFQRAQQLITT